MSLTGNLVAKEVPDDCEKDVELPLPPKKSNLEYVEEVMKYYGEDDRFQPVSHGAFEAPKVFFQLLFDSRPEI